jgi:hypothetical protein
MSRHPQRPASYASRPGSTAARISGGRGTSLRTEVVWLNPACSAALHRSRGGLFAEVAA